MLDKILRYAFGLTGGLTGLTLVRFLLIQNGMTEYLTTIQGIGLIVLVSIIFGVVMFIIGDRIIRFTFHSIEKVENTIQTITIYELLMGVGGLIAGLTIANLISIPIVKIDVVGVPISFIINVLFGICGIYFALIKKNDISALRTRGRLPKTKKL